MNSSIWALSPRLRGVRDAEEDLIALPAARTGRGLTLFHLYEYMQILIAITTVMMMMVVSGRGSKGPDYFMAHPTGVMKSPVFSESSLAIFCERTQFSPTYCHGDFCLFCSQSQQQEVKDTHSWLFHRGAPRGKPASIQGTGWVHVTLGDLQNCSFSSAHRNSLVFEDFGCDCSYCCRGSFLPNPPQNSPLNSEITYFMNFMTM